MIALRKVEALHINTREPFRQSGHARIASGVLIHPLASETHHDGLIPELLKWMNPKHASEVEQSVLVADLHQVRLLATQDVPDRAARKKIGLWVENSVAGAEG